MQPFMHMQRFFCEQGFCSKTVAASWVATNWRYALYAGYARDGRTGAADGEVMTKIAEHHPSREATIGAVVRLSRFQHTPAARTKAVATGFCQDVLTAPLVRHA
jgi:hypothetical protein